jgi:hypothetical protein
VTSAGSDSAAAAMTDLPEVLVKAVRLQRLFPPGFPWLTEAKKAGVGKIELTDDKLFGTVAGFDPEENTIRINSGADWGKIARLIEQRHHGLKILSEKEAVAFVFLHECGHARRRDRSLTHL